MTMKTLPFPVVALASILLVSTISACNKANTPPEPAEVRVAEKQQAPSAMPGAVDGDLEQLRAACPMVVQGTAVTAADTEGGVALTFTTDSGDVADLRTRVRHMAEMYGMHQGQAGRMWHHMGGAGMGKGGSGMGSGDMMGSGSPAGDDPASAGGGAGMGHMAGRGPMPAASYTTTDTEMGARLELQPTDKSQLEALREHVRWHQERLNSGECWGLQGQPTTKSSTGQK